MNSRIPYLVVGGAIALAGFVAGASATRFAPSTPRDTVTVEAIGCSPNDAVVLPGAKLTTLPDGQVGPEASYPDCVVLVRDYDKTGRIQATYTASLTDPLTVLFE